MERTVRWWVNALAKITLGGVFHAIYVANTLTLLHALLLLVLVLVDYATTPEPEPESATIEELRHDLAAAEHENSLKDLTIAALERNFAAAVESVDAMKFLALERASEAKTLAAIIASRKSQT